MTDLSELLKKAWLAVENASLPSEIQPIAFREVVRILSPAAGQAAPSRATTGDVGGASEGSDSALGEEAGSDRGVAVSEEEMYGRVMEHTGVDRGRLERLVHLDDDGPRVSLPGLQLGNSTAERARAVAQILTITRGFGLGETETALEIIRAECERLKVYDSANFSSHLKALNGFVINGSGRNRRMRARGSGIAAYPGLVDRLLPQS